MFAETVQEHGAEPGEWTLLRADGSQLLANMLVTAMLDEQGCGLATWPSASMSPSGAGCMRRWRRATGCWKSSAPRCPAASTNTAWMPTAIRVSLCQHGPV
jgi:hypothetical protein